MIFITSRLTLLKYYFKPNWKLTYQQNYRASSPYKLKEFENTVMITVPKGKNKHSYYIFER